MSGRMTATLPWPAAASGFSTAIADRVRSNWAIEIDTDTPELEALALVLAELEDELDEELLQAAAARLKASATDTASPFLAVRIIETTSCPEVTAASRYAGFPPGLASITNSDRVNPTLERGK